MTILNLFVNLFIALLSVAIGHAAGYAKGRAQRPRRTGGALVRDVGFRSAAHRLGLIDRGGPPVIPTGSGIEEPAQMPPGFGDELLGRAKNEAKRRKI